MEQHIKYTQQGKPFLKTWTLDGKLHNIDDKPARITIDDGGKIFKEEWFKYGCRERDDKDKPVVITYIGDKRWVEYYCGNLVSAEYVLMPDDPITYRP